MIALPIAIGVAAFAAAAVLLDATRTARLRQRIDAAVGAPATAEPEAPASLRMQIAERIAAADERLAESRAGRAFATSVERAGLRSRPATVLAATAAAGVALALLLSLVVGAVGIALGLVAAAAALRTLLVVRARRRLLAFDAQLPEVCASLASSLRAGHGLSLALEAVAVDAPAPAGPELRRVVTETRLGRPLGEALEALAERIPSEELRFVVTAIGLQREVGGSLAPLLETATETVRQRQAFARKVRALTASVRLSARVLVGLPVLLAVVLTLVNRDYMHPLWTTSTGHLLIAASCAGMLAGSLVLRRIAAPRE